MQMSLAAARSSLASEHATGPPVRHDVASPFCYDSEDATSMGSRTPRTPGSSTPLKYSSSLSEVRATARDTNGTLNNLMKEFEQRRQTFDGDAKALLTAGQSTNTNNSIEELRKIKHRFEGWKKEYKARLRETKARLLKNSEMDKSRRKWWGMLSSRAL